MPEQPGLSQPRRRTTRIWKRPPVARAWSGSHLAVIGPSGAGKTSLLQILATGLRPLEGRLSIGGADPWTLGGTGLKRLRSRIFYAPQVPPLPPRQRVVTALSSAR
ncbi:MAG: ATP-binding cassette domain-containing protein, partial [Betaproteobacteria bacterium]|nr:ATP-binding cassette domain-containing protein [Betaproteobacteria bacterium]